MNYLYSPKQNNNSNSTKLSFGKSFIRRKSKISKKELINQPFYESSSKTNLKLIQKELQFKLLDMSIQIENNQNSDDEELNQFSDIKSEKRNNIFEKNKREIESYKEQINYGRRKSVNVGEIKNDNLYKSNKALKNFNNHMTKEFNISKTYKLDNNPNQNINSIRNELTKTALISNKYKRKSLYNFRNNLSDMLNNNRIMFLNSNNMNLSKNNISFFNRNKNKTMNISRNTNASRINNLEKIHEFENKYRIISRKKELYDSLEDEEVIEELEEDYIFISPETRRIFTFDVFILFCILFSCFYYPIYIAQSICFCSYIPKGIKVILFFTDFLSIFDIVLSFFRAYYNCEYNLIKNNKRIIRHYLRGFFTPDLISAIPIFSYSHFVCKKYNSDGDLCFTNGVDFKYNCLKICLGLKTIKLFKVLHKKSNRGMNYFYEKIAHNFTLEKTMKMLLFVIMCAIGFNLFIGYHIYIGRQAYPNWILATNNQDKNFINLYLISFYFLITTITSVGYGDITCVSLWETGFQIVLLTIGVIAYSWVVSTVGNYVKKETRAAIKYNKDKDVLEEIRVSYPKMSFKLYNKIQKHLETVSQQQERLDTNLLVNNLPYTLKNKLMFIIYEKIINKFNFFKDCQNSDFILRILTSYIPMTAKKGNFIIHEGELVDNIVFVKEGRLCLVASINLEDPLLSINNYLGENFEDINEKMNTKLDNSLLNQSMNIGLKIKKATTEIKTFLKGTSELNEANIELEIAKCDFDNDDFNSGNFQFLNILDILKNEHYGEVYMLLQKPSPLSLRVKSKYAYLFLLRKQEAMAISRTYPNVWKKIYNKSYHNMKSIKKLTKKIIVHYCQTYGHKYKIEKALDILRHDSNNVMVNFGNLDLKKKKRKPRKIKFDLDGTYINSNSSLDKGMYPKKPILKKIRDNNDHFNNKNSTENKKKNLNDVKDNNTLIKDKNEVFVKINGIQMNKVKTLNNNIGYNNNFKVSSNNIFSKTISAEFPKTNSNNIHKFSDSHISIINKFSNNNININKFSKNNINIENKFIKNKINNKFSNNTININNININNNNNDNKNSVELDITSKMFSNFDDNNSVKNNINKKVLKRMNSNVAVRANSYHLKNKEKKEINPISSLSIKPLISGPTNNNALEKKKTIQIRDYTNLNDTKIIEDKESINKNQEIKISEEKDIDKSPITIKNLSRPLIKKLQKKMNKRRKKKKLYKMLISKISQSLAKINQNANLTILNSSLNNSINNSFQKSDTNNLQMGNVIQNSYILQDNPIPTEKNDINEGVKPLNEQELLIIPESPEFDFESSSESSKTSSNESYNNPIEIKKKVEFFISNHFNFSYNKTYENLNTISEGNYSKDINLQKSVGKLIGIYLKEKNKNDNKSSLLKNEISDKNDSIKKEKDKIKEKEKNITKNSTKKEKEQRNSFPKNKKKEEDDVWAFLNEDEPEEHEDLNFNLNSSDSKEKESSILNEKNYSKTPKGKYKKIIDFAGEAKKSKFKNNNNLFLNITSDSKTISPKSKKKKEIKNKVTRKLKKCTTIINPKKKKRKISKNIFKSNNDLRIQNKLNNNEEVNNNNNNKDNASNSNSLELSLNDNNNELETYTKNLFKNL